MYVTNLNNNNEWISETPDDVRLDIGKEASTNPNVCPEDKPFSTGTECVGCAEDEIFNFDTMEC